MMNVAPHTSDVFIPNYHSCLWGIGTFHSVRTRASYEGSLEVTARCPLQRAADSERLLQKPTTESFSHSLVITFEGECYS